MAILASVIVALSSPPARRSFSHRNAPQSRRLLWSTNSAATDKTGKSSETSLRPPFDPHPAQSAPRPPCPSGLHRFAPIVRNPPQPRASAPHPSEQWMENHKNLSPPDQGTRWKPRHRLQRELPLHPNPNRLRLQLNLNNMSPEQRSGRYLNGVEGLERLSPQQQQQWDRAVQQAHSPCRPPAPLRPHDDGHPRSPHRCLPISAQQVIDSPAFAAQFSPDERQNPSAPKHSYRVFYI